MCVDANQQIHQSQINIPFEQEGTEGTEGEVGWGHVVFEVGVRPHFAEGADERPGRMRRDVAAIVMGGNLRYGRRSASYACG